MYADMEKDPVSENTKAGLVKATQGKIPAHKDFKDKVAKPQ